MATKLVFGSPSQTSTGAKQAERHILVISGTNKRVKMATSSRDTEDEVEYPGDVGLTDRGTRLSPILKIGPKLRDYSSSKVTAPDPKPVTKDIRGYYE